MIQPVNKSQAVRIFKKWDLLQQECSRLFDTIYEVKNTRNLQDKNFDKKQPFVGLPKFIIVNGTYNLHNQTSFQEEISKSPKENNNIPPDWESLFEKDFLLKYREAQSIINDNKAITNKKNMVNGSNYIEDELIDDDDIINIVIEEYQEILPKISSQIDLFLDGDNSVIKELHRNIHTLKGSFGQINALKTRSLIHKMESTMEKLESNIEVSVDEQKELLNLFNEAQKYIKVIISGDKKNIPKIKNNSSEEKRSLVIPKTIRVDTQKIDSLILEINESYLTNFQIENTLSSSRKQVNELEFNFRKVLKVLQELEMETETQIQSHEYSPISTSDNNFDPLQKDRFTKLQELSRFTMEGISDIIEVKNELNDILLKEDTFIAQQNRLLQSIKQQLHKTRLMPVNFIKERLANIVSMTAKEEKKSILFKMIGGQIELDRVLLEKIIPPLDHVLRNAVVHGIEDNVGRIENNKKKEGVIKVSFKQDVGYVFISISDDGSGLDKEKIKQKAVEKHLWDKNKDITDEAASELICTPGFSTADNLSQRAGRGVGMDVVREKIIELGGSFNIKSTFHVGMEINIKIPTSLSTMPIMVVSANDRKVGIPIDQIEHVIRTDKNINVYSFLSSQKHLNKWKNASNVDLTVWIKNNYDIPNDKIKENKYVLLLKERQKYIVLHVDQFLAVVEVPVKKSGSIYSNIKGISSVGILPDGHAIHIIDPFRIRVANIKENMLLSKVDGDDIKNRNNRNTPHKTHILIVDDSITIRKVSSNFLLERGYEVSLAKDGQEAMDKMNSHQYNMVLLDIEMPKVDGFECLKWIRNNSKFKDIPVCIISSRSAQKHKDMAFKLGANGFMTKPFKDKELLKFINHFEYQK